MSKSKDQPQYPYLAKTYLGDSGLWVENGRKLLWRKPLTRVFREIDEQIVNTTDPDPAQQAVKRSHVRLEAAKILADMGKGKIAKLGASIIMSYGLFGLGTFLVYESSPVVKNITVIGLATLACIKVANEAVRSSAISIKRGQYFRRGHDAPSFTGQTGITIARGHLSRR